MWATRPHLANIFEKLLDQKTFQFACGSGLETILLKKTVFPVRQKGVPPLLLPTSVLQLPRCLARTYNLDFHDATLFELNSFKRCNCSRKNRLQNLVCSANVGCSPTPRQHFWKTAAPKNFSVRLRLGSSITIPIKKQGSLWFEKSLLFYQWLETVRFNHSVIPTIKTANNNK